MWSGYATAPPIGWRVADVAVGAERAAEGVALVGAAA